MNIVLICHDCDQMYVEGYTVSILAQMKMQFD